MQKMAKYVIFHTKWGYFGLAGTDSALCRTCLPERTRGKVEARLLGKDSIARFDAGYFKPLQEQIEAYYEGACVNFDPEIPVLLDGFRPFRRRNRAAPPQAVPQGEHLPEILCRLSSHAIECFALTAASADSPPQAAHPSRRRCWSLSSQVKSAAYDSDGENTAFLVKRIARFWLNRCRLLLSSMVWSIDRQCEYPSLRHHC